MEQYDIIILGAGAAGLFCAGTALQQGMRVAVLDHMPHPGEKIRISGGGRCNFTNMNIGRERFLSSNPRFAASALARYRPQQFVDLVDQAGIAWHEKDLGQLFCDGKATQITDLLLERMRGAYLILSCTIDQVTRGSDGFALTTSEGMMRAPKLVVATGGKSIPKIGASNFAYDLAQQFGLRMVDTRPALVPLTFADQDLAQIKPLAGIAVDAEVSHGKTRFSEPLLFTHRGISGPSILQISSYWMPGDEITINLKRGTDIAAALRGQRQQGGRGHVSTALGAHLPSRLADAITEDLGLGGERLADQNNKVLDRVGARVNAWQVKPVGSEGYRTAEVTMGGIDTRDLDAKTMEARTVPGLYFIGEAVDVTGWLGGYNFQWAWASAYAAGVHLRGPGR